MKVSSILLPTIVLISISSIANSHSSHTAMEEGNPTTPTICSCSPTEFEFVLNLDQECTIVTKYRESNDGVRQQGNDVFESNPGLAGSFCTVDQNVVVPTAASDEGGDEDDAEDEPLRRRSLQGQWQWRTYTPTYSPTSEVVDEVMLRLGEEDIPTPLVGDEENEEEEEEDDPVIEVVSIQFLEFDISNELKVINQDNTYANVSLASGKRIKFTSVSSFLDTTLPLDSQMDSPALVPGGASLILYGKTESGKVVRNRFFWTYSMDCENVPVTVGNKLGWIEVVEVSNAWPAFCPALPPNSPTITPRTIEPTMTPLYQDTTEPPTVSDSGPGSKGSKSNDSKVSKPGYSHSHMHDHDLEQDGIIYFWSKGGKGSKSYYTHDHYQYDHYYHDHYHYHYYEPVSSHASSMSMSMSMDTKEEETEPKKYHKKKRGKGSKSYGYGKSSKGRGNHGHKEPAETEEFTGAENSAEAESSSTPSPSSTPVPTTTGTSETGQLDSIISSPPTIAGRGKLRAVETAVFSGSYSERSMVVPIAASAAAMVLIMLGLVYHRKFVRSHSNQ